MTVFHPDALVYQDCFWEEEERVMRHGKERKSFTFHAHLGPQRAKVVRWSLLWLAIGATLLPFAAPVRADQRKCYIQEGTITEANRRYIQCLQVEQQEHVQMLQEECRIRALEDATAAQERAAQAQRDAAWAAQRQAEAARWQAEAAERAARAQEEAARAAHQNAGPRTTTCTTKPLGYGRTTITCD